MEKNNMLPTDNNFEVKGLLKILLECAKQNADKKPGGRRYSTTIKELGTLLFIIGGRHTTVKAHLDNTIFIKEGEFRFQALKKFLNRRNLPLKIWLSEDGTHVTGRIQYCSKTNQIVGFVLPLDNNGLPIIDSFPATSAEAIKSYFDSNETSHVVYCIIDKPLVHESPSFCLAMFGTDNRFTSNDVVKRWAWMKREANKYGIEIKGMSSDGDEKLLKAMLYKSVTNTSKEWPFFECHLSQDIVFIQDTIHLVTKLKSRLIKPSIILDFPLENIWLPVDIFWRDQHNLTACLLNPKDKMNFSAVQKLCDKKVTDLLRKCVAGSEATACYLDMIREVMSAFLLPALSPSERIFLLWKWVFFARIWRNWIETHDDYTLKNNFLTRVSYLCLELNAHGLVQIIRNLRDSGDEELFLPENFDSQPCESSFRELRSMTSTHSTIVNVSVLEFQHRVRRIDFVTESKKCQGYSELFFASYAVAFLPGDTEIEKNISDAFKSAVDILTIFGICIRNVNLPVASLPIIALPDLGVDDDNLSESETEFNSDESNLSPCEPGVSDEIFDSNMEEQNEDLQLVEEDLIMLSPNSLYVLVKDGDGNCCSITKQSLLLLLSNGDTKLSSDRLLRVQVQRVTHKPLWSSELSLPTIEDFVSLGHWCAFLAEDGTSICVGRILAFSYLSGSKHSDQQYSALSAPTKPPEKNARGLGCLCSWFTITKTMVLQTVSMDVDGYYSIANYKCTLPRPKLSGTKITLQCSLPQIKRAKKS
ncbi:hypothetical protein FOCC_FOCC015324 [Frankliniella occidentalis]|nr:hypothetical protein FOCC_FOCC015324 [Frankliniella occidentalis]